MSLVHGASIITDGLVLCLDAANPKSYPGTGTTLYNIKEYSNNAILYNGATYTSNNIGSLYLDGTNDYVSFTNPINPLQPYTVIVWAKPDVALINGATPPNGTNRKTPLVGPGPVWNPGIWVTRDNIRVHCETQYRDHTISWGDLSWKMLGQTFDTSVCKIIYQNEVVDGYRIIGYAPPEPTQIYLGAEASGGSSINWNGRIGVTLFYNRVLTSSEIQQNFNALRGRYGI